MVIVAFLGVTLPLDNIVVIIIRLLLLKYSNILRDSSLACNCYIISLVVNRLWADGHTL